MSSSVMTHLRRQRSRLSSVRKVVHPASRFFSFWTAIVRRSGPRVTEFPAEPGPGEYPEAIDRAGRYAERCGGLLPGQAGEVAEFDETGLERVQLRQSRESPVELEEIR